MIVHSLVIHFTKDIRPAVFTLGATWEITTKRSLDTIIRHITKRTMNDKNGRVLCVGRARASFAKRVVSTPADQQNRLFVVKYGHDGKLWTRNYPLYDDAVNTLRTK